MLKELVTQLHSFTLDVMQRYGDDSPEYLSALVNLAFWSSRHWWMLDSSMALMKEIEDHPLATRDHKYFALIGRAMALWWDDSYHKAVEYAPECAAEPLYWIARYHNQREDYIACLACASMARLLSMPRAMIFSIRAFDIGIHTELCLCGNKVMQNQPDHLLLSSAQLVKNVEDACNHTLNRQNQVNFGARDVQISMGLLYEATKK